MFEKKMSYSGWRMFEAANMVSGLKILRTLIYLNYNLYSNLNKSLILGVIDESQ